MSPSTFFQNLFDFPNDLDVRSDGSGTRRDSSDQGACRYPPTGLPSVYQLQPVFSVYQRHLQSIARLAPNISCQRVSPARTNRGKCRVTIYQAGHHGRWSGLDLVRFPRSGDHRFGTPTIVSLADGSTKHLDLLWIFFVAVKRHYRPWHYALEMLDRLRSSMEWSQCIVNASQPHCSQKQLLQVMTALQRRAVTTAVDFH